jgi:hypothetical protein
MTHALTEIDVDAMIKVLNCVLLVDYLENNLDFK